MPQPTGSPDAPRRPLVSIGVPVFNGDRFLGDALHSILSQDYENIEVLISDNASTDGTAAICRRVADRDTRVRYQRNEFNIGPLANYCRVVDRSRGTYFLWAADDDQRSLQYVSSLVAELEANEHAVLATGTTIYCDPDGQATAMRPCPPAPGPTPRENIVAFFETHADGWFYGVYRLGWLQKHVREQTRFHVWGGDLLWLASVVLRFPVLGHSQAVLTKRVKPSRYQPRTWLTRSDFRVRMLLSFTAIALRDGSGLRAKLTAWSSALKWYHRMFIRRGNRLKSAYRGVRLVMLDLLLSLLHLTGMTRQVRE